ncbi:glycosyltransferase [Microbacterium sp. ASV49]|uniref:Glycosyltransferase n=1 Tax=Microbacterium candidum TaxID=3041922 RepID=A0ABT7MUS2_9MICO|nr:glycosyltransferase [Microbacterium sp. ASV49]MDL9978194.1 glycosyltransferase [Microbacterium sp. ASV49]
MRILIASVPAAGHFNPLTAPAVRLHERGHDVRWYAGPIYGPKAEALGIPVIPYREAVEITADNLNELFPERARLHGPKAIAFDADAFFSRPVRAMFDDVRAIRAGFPFDAMFIDGAFYAGYLVAKKLGVPVFAQGSIAAPSVRNPGDVTPFFSLRPPRTAVGRVVNRIARSVVIASGRQGTDRFNAVLADEGLPPIGEAEFMDCTMQPDAARRTFVVGIPELEFPGLALPPNNEWVGALLPQPRRTAVPLDPRIASWPGRVIVVTQGTVDTDPEKLIVPTIEALRGSGALIVAATGGMRTDELRRRFAGPDVVVEDFMDFERAFATTDLYVTNGGMGGVLLALTHGVPMLTAGTREGKGDINARLAYRGLAVDLRTETPSVRAIRRGADRALADDRMRGRVAEVQRLLAGYDSVGLVVEGIEEEVSAARITALDG